MVNLDLPGTIDTAEHGIRTSHDSGEIAAYTLIPLGDGEHRRRLEALLRNNEHVGDMCQLCIDVQFPSAALQDVLLYHLSNAERHGLNPTLFVVVHAKDFEQEGALLVNADVDLKGRVAKQRLKVDDVVLSAANINIGNMDWDELESLDPQSPVENVPKVGEDVLQPQPECFGIYGVVKGANLTAIRGLLEPDWTEKDPRLWKCEGVGTYDKYDEQEDNIAEVVKWHPWHCRRVTRMNRRWCICVNNTAPAEQGVVLLRIGWDESLGREPRDLLEVGTKTLTIVEPVRSALQSLLTHSHEPDS